MFERGIRLQVAVSVHCCIHTIHTDTHTCMYVCYQELVRPWEVACKHWTDAAVKSFCRDLAWRIWCSICNRNFQGSSSSPFSPFFSCSLEYSPWFPELIPLKVQSGQLLNDILIYAPIATTNFRISPKPITCLLNCGKWVERGVYLF